jgi:hypothetical protein
MTMIVLPGVPDVGCKMIVGMGPGVADETMTVVAVAAGTVVAGGNVVATTVGANSHAMLLNANRAVATVSPCGVPA